MRKNIIVFCYSLLFLSSCFKDLDYSLDFEGEKIVVRGTISPQDGAIIQITHTLNPQGTYYYDSLDINLEQAIVKLYENEIIVKQIKYSGNNGFYQDKELDLKMGVNYHLTVEATGYPPVKSEKIMIPNLPEIEFATIEQDKEEVRIDIDLKDDKETSYYQLLVDGIYDNQLIELDYFLAGSYEQWESCGITYDRSLRFTYIKDDCFKNKSYLFPTLINVNNVRIQTGTFSDILFEPPEEIILRFRSTTSEIYNYEESSNFPEDVDNAFREPPTTFTNIEGGYGYFSAYQETTYNHKL